MFFEPAFLSRSPVAVVRRGGELIAFASVWPGAAREELAADLVRYRPDAPPGIVDALLARILLWGRAEGYRWFDLGLAPAERPPGGPLGPVHLRIAAAGFRFAEHVPEPVALRRFKDRFEPEWVPRYLALPGGLALPRMLEDVAALLERPVLRR